MVDPFSWADMGRWLLGLRRVLPDRVLRWVWSQEKLLVKVRVFTVAEPPPHFFVQVERENPELTHLAFHVLNLTPFKLGIVAASGTLTLDSRVLGTRSSPDWLRLSARFADVNVFPGTISVTPRGNANMGRLPEAENDALSAVFAKARVRLDSFCLRA